MIGFLKSDLGGRPILAEGGLDEPLARISEIVISRDKNSEMQHFLDGSFDITRVAGNLRRSDGPRAKTPVCSSPPMAGQMKRRRMCGCEAPAAVSKKMPSC
jgi:hypothetical protein